MGMWCMDWTSILRNCNKIVWIFWEPAGAMSHYDDFDLWTDYQNLILEANCVESEIRWHRWKSFYSQAYSLNVVAVKRQFLKLLWCSQRVYSNKDG
jgi:hypothetical protein